MQTKGKISKKNYAKKVGSGFGPDPRTAIRNMEFQNDFFSLSRSIKKVRFSIAYKK